MARQVLKLLAANNAGELVKSRVARVADIPEGSVQSYLDLLEALYLIQQIPAWGNNLIGRVTGRSKVALLDSGLATRLNNVTPAAMLPGVVGEAAGALFAAFVAGELRRQMVWAETDASMFHFRDRNGLEVDLVLEDGERRVAGIEVKSARTVKKAHFRGLEFLRDKLGNRFTIGVLLYTGPDVIPFGDRLWALPHSALWT